jgi:hypothetical protein
MRGRGEVDAADQEQGQQVETQMSRSAEALRRAANTYASSAKGRATKAAWRKRHRDKIRRWKRAWASSDNGRDQARGWYRKSPLAMFSLYAWASKRRGLEFLIERIDFIHLLAQPCSYCGKTALEAGGRNGIDRIDNGLGYTVVNVVTCCFTCNQMKSKRSVSEFISHAKRIATHNQVSPCH